MKGCPYCIEFENNGTFNELKKIRKCVTAALELKRNEKLIGSSLQAKVTLYISLESQKILEKINLFTLYLSIRVKKFFCLASASIFFVIS